MLPLSRIFPLLLLLLIQLDLTSAALASYPGDPNVSICGDDKGKTPECTARVSDDEIRDLRAIRMRLRLFIRDGLDFEDLTHPGLLGDFDRESLEMEIRETKIRDRMENENHESERRELEEGLKAYEEAVEHQEVQRRDLEDGLKAYEDAVEQIAHVVKAQRLIDAARDARGPRMGRRSGREMRRSRARRRRLEMGKRSLKGRMME